MTHLIFILLFSLSCCTHNLFGMDALITIPAEGGEISDDSDTTSDNEDTPQASLDEEFSNALDAIVKQIDAEIRCDNAQNMKRREIFIPQGIKYTSEMLARVQENSVQHYELLQIVDNGLLGKLRAKNPLFDRAFTDSVRYFHAKFANVTPETLDFIDHPKYQTSKSFNRLADPIKTYIMEEAKNSSKSHAYWLAHYESPDKKIKKYNCHNVYMCRLAIMNAKNAKKTSSLPQIYGSHQFKESTEYEQKMIREEIEKLAPKATIRPLSPSIKY